MTLPHGRDGLSARRMAVLWTFREPSLYRHGRREFMRNAMLDLPPILPVTACHQGIYVERYSTYKEQARLRAMQLFPGADLRRKKDHDQAAV